MHPLVLLTAAVTCALARPPSNGGIALPTAVLPLSEPMQEPFQPQYLREAFNDYLRPQHVLPSYRYIMTREEALSPPRTQYDWLSREIERLNLMEAVENELAEGYEPTNNRETNTNFYNPIIELMLPAHRAYAQRIQELKRNMEPMEDEPEEESIVKEKSKYVFAYTPFDKEFFEPDPEELIEPASASDPEVIPQDKSAVNEPPPLLRQQEMKASMTLHEPRQIRQNPNLSKTKSLVAKNLDELRSGVAGKDYRVPVSLLPSNLRWLKISHSEDELGDNENKSSFNHDHEVRMKGDTSTDSIYGVAVIAAVGAALAVAILGFTFGWYTLSKKAKAAADVDYPAYGVTGPNTDTSGDRKLAHSAHMYHYQHQKQQILAMEKNGMERKGSISDPESEEENEEGDYTVYECPGFATTGDMEVKNPMFNDDPTPTPGKAEVVKPQPKE